MSLKEIIDRRYSCRQFQEKEVEREKIIRCIEAARMAPSACNSQPWRFIVVDDPELKKKLVSVARSGIFGVMNHFLNQAPVIIVVVAQREKFLSEVGGKIMSTSYYLIDIGIACENLVLQATELGLGTCFVGYFNERGVKKLLRIPRREKVVLLIAMGYPGEDIKKKKRRKSLGKILHFNLGYNNSS